MKSIVGGIVLAFQFLTRIPLFILVPWNQQTLTWALRSYPLVGLCMGAILSGLYLLLYPSLDAWMLAIILLTVWVALTGGLHLDGWMDVADAVGSNAPLEKKWMIMKDPHVGSFGILAVLFLMAWKATLLYQLMARVPLNSGHQYEMLVLFLCIPMLSRFGAILLLYHLPSAKQEGLAWEWKKYIKLHDLWISILPMGLFLFIYPLLSIFAVIYLLFLVGYAWWIQRTFGGVNGDIIGASIEGGELWGLTVLYLWCVMV